MVVGGREVYEAGESPKVKVTFTIMVRSLPLGIMLYHPEMSQRDWRSASFFVLWQL
jgi:hypothetical protein